VLFRAPVPLSLEERLLQDLGSLARVEPDGVFSRWIERNQEFCDCLAASASAFGVEERQRPRSEQRLPFGSLLGRLAAVLEAPTPGGLAWCFGCSRLGTEALCDCPRGGPSLTLLEAGPPRRLATFAAFLESHPSPPDPRLREREGDERLLARVERGDFGQAYRVAWSRFVARAARECLRTEVRRCVAAQRAAGEPVDLAFTSGGILLRRETLGAG
jgi:hypothetical protein